MGYLNGLINASFKEKDSNTSIFFPYGQFGTGYILSKSEDREAKKFLKLYYTITFISIIIAAIFFGYYTLFLMAILLPLYFIKIHSFLNGKEKLSAKYKMSDSMITMAISMGFLTRLLLFLAGILLFAGSIFISIKTNHKILGLIGIIFFGLSVAVSFKLLIIKHSDK